MASINNKKNDPGLGSSFFKRTKRVINKDGSFNVYRKGSQTKVVDVYQYIIGVSWTLFLVYVFAFYIGINLLFAVLYSAAGNDALSSFGDTGFVSRLPDAFYFSTQTFTSVGYGGICLLYTSPSPRDA